MTGGHPLLTLAALAVKHEQTTHCKGLTVSLVTVLPPLFPSLQPGTYGTFAALRAQVAGAAKVTSSAVAMLAAGVPAEAGGPAQLRVGRAAGVHEALPTLRSGPCQRSCRSRADASRSSSNRRMPYAASCGLTTASAGVGAWPRA